MAGVRLTGNSKRFELHITDTATHIKFWIDSWASQWRLGDNPSGFLYAFFLLRICWLVVLRQSYNFTRSKVIMFKIRTRFWWAIVKAHKWLMSCVTSHWTERNFAEEFATHYLHMSALLSPTWPMKRSVESRSKQTRAVVPDPITLSCPKTGYDEKLIPTKIDIISKTASHWHYEAIPTTPPPPLSDHTWPDLASGGWGGGDGDRGSSPTYLAGVGSGVIYLPGGGSPIIPSPRTNKHLRKLYLPRTMYVVCNKPKLVNELWRFYGNRN